MIRVEGSIRDDDMVHEENAHDLTGLVDLVGQQIIVFAWNRIVAGMVMADSQDGGIVEEHFFHDEADIYGCFCDTAMRDAFSLNEFEVLVHQENPTFFHIEILHAGGACSCK